MRKLIIILFTIAVAVAANIRSERDVPISQRDPADADPDTTTTTTNHHKPKHTKHISLDDVDDVDEQPKNKLKKYFSSVLQYCDPDLKRSYYINR